MVGYDYNELIDQMMKIQLGYECPNYLLNTQGVVVVQYAPPCKKYRVFRLLGRGTWAPGAILISTMTTTVTISATPVRAIIRETRTQRSTRVRVSRAQRHSCISRTQNRT